MKSQFLFLFLLILVVGTVSAVDVYFPQKQNTDFNLVVTSNNATECNWTYTQYPDGSKTDSNIELTKVLQDFSYNVSAGNFSQIGVTCMGVTCSDGSTYESGSICRNVTSNGKDNPDGIIVFIFIFLFLLLLGGTCYLSLYSIGHFLKLDFSITDLAIDWGIYFMIIGLYFLEEFYLGNAVIKQFLNWFLIVGGILLVLIPICAFITSIFVGTMGKRKVDYNPPQLWRGR